MQLRESAEIFVKGAGGKFSGRRKYVVFGERTQKRLDIGLC